MNNTGYFTAYNAGLHVVIYDNGVLVGSITVPLANGPGYGTDAATAAYVSQGGIPSTQLGSLDGGGTAAINVRIYHEGNATNWTVTPVWTNSP